MSELINVIKKQNVSLKLRMKELSTTAYNKHLDWIKQNSIDYSASLPCKYEIPHTTRRKYTFIFRVVFVIGLLALLYT